METDVLIVGGGFGGVETAIPLRSRASQASITLVTKAPHLVYKPWLVYLPAQRKQFDQCLIPLEPMAERFRVQRDRGERDEDLSRRVPGASGQWSNHPLRPGRDCHRLRG